MKRVITISFAVVAIAILVNSAVTADAPNNGKFDLLKVRKLVVGGDVGKPSVVLESAEDVSGITILDSSDNVRGAFVFSVNSGIVFSMTRRDRKSSVSVEIDDTSGAMVVTLESPDGKPGVQIVSEKNGHVIMTKDSTGTPRTAHGFINGAVVNEIK